MWRMIKINSKLRAWPHQVTSKLITPFEAHCAPKQLNELLLAKPLSHPVKLIFESLAPKERAALILRYHQHYSPHQIAYMLGLSTQALNNLFESIFNKLSKTAHRFI